MVIITYIKREVTIMINVSHVYYKVVSKTLEHAPSKSNILKVLEFDTSNTRLWWRR